jgi:hypothetical protein
MSSAPQRHESSAAARHHAATPRAARPAHAAAPPRRRRAPRSPCPPPSRDSAPPSGPSALNGSRPLRGVLAAAVLPLVEPLPLGGWRKGGAVGQAPLPRPGLAGNDLTGGGGASTPKGAQCGGSDCC